MRHLLCLIAFLCLPAFAQSDADLVATRSAEFSRQIANTHPRLLIRPADLPALRTWFATLQSTADGRRLARAAQPALNQPLIAEPSVVKNGTEEGSILWREGYRAAIKAGSTAQRHAFAWRLTQDPAHGREAARWLMHLASWQITDDTYRTNDELFIQHLRPMIFAYDWAFDALSAEERATVRSALESRLSILARRIQPKFSLTAPTPPDNSLSHPLRFMSTLGQGGLALLHESAAAPGWLAWTFEYYLRQFPVWGGDAGGWAEGLNYWNTGITQHQRFLEGMALLGFDAPLHRPFWQNTAYFGIYNQMPYGGSFFGDLNNISKPSGSLALLLEKAATLNRDPYPLAFARALQQKPPTGFTYYTYDGLDALLQAFRTEQAALPAVNLADLPQSRYFDDIGVVAMHSALGDAAHDIMLAFRASPQGSASHGFADQNSFVLNAFGEPLAINSGYREFYGSAHHVGWSRQTKAKNALLFGGEGQRIRDASATGRITRFADGAHFSFATGDASVAYAPHAEQALRHVFFVDRRYFVILDEARAPAPVKFQWQLHARSEMTLAPEVGEIIQQQGDARLSVRFLQPAARDLSFSQTDAFDPPVLPAFQKKMPNEWHATAESITTARQSEFLALLHPWQTNAPASAPPTTTRIPAQRGFALRHGNDLVLIAREAEKQVEAADWQLAGMAASLSQQGDALRFTLIEATRLSGVLNLKASAPVSLEGVRNSYGMSITSSLRAPVTLQIKPGFVVKNITGAQNWQQGADGVVTLELPPGALQISVVK